MLSNEHVRCVQYKATLGESQRILEEAETKVRELDTKLKAEKTQSAAIMKKMHAKV